jgi:threonine dehydrogenase-like Zn-dependent dehydrogenase
MHAVNRIAASTGGLPGAALLLGYGPIGALVHTELVRRRPDIVVAVVEPDSLRWQMAQAGGAIAPEAGRLWPLVIDAAGYQDSLSDALAATKNGGTVALVALAHSPVSISAQSITEASETIVGCIGFVDELADAVAALASDPQNYRWLITEAVSLADAPKRLAELLTRPAAGKCVVRL